MLKPFQFLLATALMLAAGAESHSYKTHSNGVFAARFPEYLAYHVDKDPDERAIAYSAGKPNLKVKPFFAVMHFPGQNASLQSLIDQTQEGAPTVALTRRVMVDGVKGAEFTGAIDGLPVTMRVFPGKRGAWNVIGRSIDPPENQRFVESFHFRKAP